MSYTHTITVPMSYAQAVEATREALADQGFGILTEIDVKATFTKKLGEETGDAVGTTSSSAPATPPWPAEPWPLSLSSAPCCLATWWSGEETTRITPPSTRSTRRPWSSSAARPPSVKSPKTQSSGCAQH